jgi:hypothetical protein
MTPADREFLNKVAARYRTSKRRGIIYAILGAISIGMAAYVSLELYQRTMEITDRLSDASALVDDEALRQEARVVSNDLGFVMGVIITTTAFSLLSLGSFLISEAIYLLSGARMERLLVELSHAVRD